MRYSKNLKWFGLISTIGMLFILLGGSLVTKTDSGMGCGRHWPGCNGKLIPDVITTEVLIEFSHRLVTGVVGIAIVLLAVWSWKALGHIRETKFLAITAVFFLILQALIGAAQVLWGQGDFILALHFGISLISFAAVLLLTLIVFEVDKKFDADGVRFGSKLRFHTIGITVYAYLVIYTGALVRHTNSELVCPSWPFCHDGSGSSSLMPASFEEWVQMGHRLAAGLLFLWIVYAAIHAVKHYKDQRVLYWGWIIAATLVTLQVIAGAIVIFTKANLIVAMFHSLFVTLLFGLLTYFILLLYRSKQ
ncbi:COX15/CtaA family protein [Savagea faecisuis]|uniref:Heme A synthase n=1 Tax=Savagea faecisuis TaxID=1274803 RepID=A0ABW3GY60_9BACL